MSKRTHAFVLDGERDDAKRSAVRAVSELGWEVAHEADVIVVREDPAGLCCSMAPSQARINLEQHDDRTVVRLDLTVPGFGPGPKRQLADRAAGLEQRIRRWSEAPSEDRGE